MVFYRKFLKNSVFIILASSFCFLSVFFFTRASVIIVDDPTGDDVDNGLCSIVEAMRNAALDDTSGSVDCVAGSGSDVISIQTDIVLDTVLSEFGGDPIGSGVPDNGGVNVTINGNGFTISRDPGAPQMRIFRFHGAGSEIALNDLTISGGDVDSPASRGGAIFATIIESLTLNNVTFDSNTAASGGAIYILVESAPGVDLNMNRVTFSNNTSSGVGGAVVINNNRNSPNATNITATDLIVNTNTSGGNGGAFYLNNVSSSDISDSYFTVNRSSGLNGGVFYLTGKSQISVVDSYFYRNRSSTTLGGVFYVEGFVEGEPGSSVEVSRSTFEDNVAGKGGVFYLNNGANLTAYNSSFNSSVAIDSGGVIYSYQNQTNYPNEINFYHNNTFNSFSGNNGGTTMFNCIFSEGACKGNTGTIFTGDSYFFENNLLSGGGCDGNIENASFINNLDGNFGDKCSETGLGNIISTNFSNALAVKGGPWKTFALSSGSNAIDTAVAGTLGCPATDARGVPRPFGSACDIGAYEYTGGVDVVITESGGGTEVSESGTTDTYTINLGEGPSSSVTINLTKDIDDFNISPSSVTFTTLNWFTPQTITVSVDDNSNYDDDFTRSIFHTVVSSDVGYSALTPDSVSVSIVNNDTRSTTSSGSGGGGNPPPPPPPPADVFGCTDPLALNFISNANISDNSCTYRPVEIFGCTNSGATNYNNQATTNDGYCVFPVVPPEPVVPEPFDPVVDPSVEPTVETIDPVIVEVVQPKIEPIMPNFVEPDLNKKDFSLQESLEKIPKKISESLALGGLALPFIAFVFTQPAAAASIPLRIFNILPTLFGLKRRKRPWGTVYDSVTKQPLDPVYLVLEDLNGKQIATSITDIDGRFGFLVPAGFYRIKAKKSDYEFPSKKLLGKQKDELYSDLYFNDIIEVKNDGDLIIKNIPMDPTKFNWNEFEKSKNKDLMRFYSKRDLFLARISSAVFYAGAISSGVLFIASPSPLNYLILGVYALFLVFKLFGVKVRKPGYVLEKETGHPLSFGIARVFSKSSGVEMSHAVINKTGKYYSLLPNGEYYVEVNKKTGEDSYEKVFSSDMIKVKNGYLGNIFRV